MKFLVDAQLPPRLARQLTAAGGEAVHSSDLPDRNRTKDKMITSIAVTEQRIVVTKDEDFVIQFHLRGAPPKLLLISTGNISNDALEQIVRANLTNLFDALSKHNFVELTLSAIVIHG